MGAFNLQRIVKRRTFHLRHRAARRNHNEARTALINTNTSSSVSVKRFREPVEWIAKPRHLSSQRLAIKKLR
jgi:hypothetical protein